MKSERSKRVKWVCGAVIVYVLLLCALISAESGNPDASINSLSSALWYSVTTLTTVGYGDTYPLTNAGRLIGFIFQMMSLGILAAMFSFLMRFFRGKLLPMLMLHSKRNRTWAILSAVNENSVIFARNLLSAEPDNLIIFADETSDEASGLPGMAVSVPVREIIRWQKGKGKCIVFCMDEDHYKNRLLAQQLQEENAEVFCFSHDEPDTIPDHQEFFNDAMCRARLYWHMYPLADSHEKIVIIGEGPSARALFEQGLIVNIVSPDQSVTYTLTGDWDDFRRNHPFLFQAASFAEENGGDVIHFTNAPWNADWEIFHSASRIIICFEEEAENAACLSALRRYCPVGGTIYVRNSLSIENAVSFGGNNEIFTPDLIMHRKLSHLAEAMHNSYLEKHGGSLPGWNHLSDFLRRSNLASADHLYMKALILNQSGQMPEASGEKEFFESAAEKYRKLDEDGIRRCRRIEHMRWNRFHLLNNWEYAAVRDNAMRRHPLIRPFDQLSAEDQAKDDYAWELLEEAVTLL